MKTSWFHMKELQELSINILPLGKIFIGFQDIGLKSLANYMKL